MGYEQAKRDFLALLQSLVPVEQFGEAPEQQPEPIKHKWWWR